MVCMLGGRTRIRFNSKKFRNSCKFQNKVDYIGWNFVDDGYFVEYVRGKVDVNRKKDARFGSEGKNSWRQVVHVVQIDVFLTKINEWHSKNWKIIAMWFHSPDYSFASISLLTSNFYQSYKKLEQNHKSQQNLSYCKIVTRNCAGFFARILCKNLGKKLRRNLAEMLIYQSNSVVPLNRTQHASPKHTLNRRVTQSKQECDTTLTTAWHSHTRWRINWCVTDPLGFGWLSQFIDWVETPTMEFPHPSSLNRDRWSLKPKMDFYSAYLSFLITRGDTGYSWTLAWQVSFDHQARVGSAYDCPYIWARRAALN